MITAGSEAEEEPWRTGRFIRKLDAPLGFTVPTTLTYDDIVARAISRADLHEDVKGINASLELIRHPGCVG